MNEENMFNLFQFLFFLEVGVLKYVVFRQRKLFVEQVWERLESEERLEFQGSDVLDLVMCVSMISLLVSDVGDKLELVRKKESNDNEKDGIDSNDLKLEE